MVLEPARRPTAKCRESGSHLETELPRVTNRNRTVRIQRWHQPSRRSRGAASREVIRRNSPSKRVSLYSAIRMRWAGFKRPCLKSWDETESTSSSESYTNALLSFAVFKSHSDGPDAEELIAAKMMGRWRSGAPLALCPFHDDPALGKDPHRNNDFLFQTDDPIGFKRLQGSHIRRTNPRDAQIAGMARIHRMISGTAYGPPLPEGVIEDDGADRGLMFAFVGGTWAGNSSSSSRNGSTTAFSLALATIKIRSLERLPTRVVSQYRSPCESAFMVFRSSLSRAGANTASCRGCALCVGSPIFRRSTPMKGERISRYSLLSG